MKTFINKMHFKFFQKLKQINFLTIFMYAIDWQSPEVFAAPKLCRFLGVRAG